MNKKNILDALNDVWNYIGADALEAFGDDKGMKRSEVIELCLDASRLETLTDKAYEEDIALFRQLPYKKQMTIAKEAFPFKYYGM